MSEKVITETTMKRIAEALKDQATMLSAISKGWKIEDWNTVAEIVQSNLASKYFQVGDRFFISYTDVDYHYPSVPIGVRHIGPVRDAEGNEHPGMILQWDCATPFGIQFDAPENTPTTDETFQEGFYYYLKQENGSYTQQTVEVGAPIPEEQTYVKLPFPNATSIISYGYNRWSHSAYRQWLNSDKPKGEWWEPQHEGDTPPNELNQHDGFMKGLPADFLAVVKPIQVVSYKNTVTDDGEFEITNDRFFLPSVEEMYGAPQLVGEGEAWQYWKEATGFDMGKNDTCPGRVTYALENQKAAQFVRLRSASRGSSFWAWKVSSAGSLYSGTASESLRAAPACAIW